MLQTPQFDVDKINYKPPLNSKNGICRPENNSNAKMVNVPLGQGCCSAELATSASDSSSFPTRSGGAIFHLSTYSIALFISAVFLIAPDCTLFLWRLGIQSTITMLIRLDSLTEQARLLINSRLDDLDSSLHQQINKAIHSHPETAYEEFFAHDTITKYLQDLGFRVTKHAYGLKTSFEASLGSGGRQVVFCAEYDALPGIGHGCGHNLIATASVGAFLGAAHALATLKIPGRLRLLGTPAEENGCGKGKLIEAGAFDPPEDVAAAIMAHAVPASLIDSDTGVAGLRLISSHQFRVEFRGHAAHAGGEPWNGVNALDAAVAAYSNVSLLRQQIHPDERIHGVIEDGGTIPGVIPDYTRMHWNVRSPTMERGEKLLQRVKACLEAGAAATGCQINYILQGPGFTFNPVL